MALPNFILLKSNNHNQLLRYRKEEDSKHAFLQFSQDEKEKNPEIQYSKFEVQKSETVQGFVHIRSCYNNKYWVRKSADNKWIVADANEPEEDQSKWCCTLFKAILLDSHDDVPATANPHPQKIRLVHSDQLGQNHCVLSETNLAIGDTEGSRTTTMTSEGGDDDVFVAYDAKSVFVLPQYVAFMGPNDKYGAPTTISGGVIYLEFKTTDIGHAGVSHMLDQSPLSQPPFIAVKNPSVSVPTQFEVGYWRGRPGFEFIVLDNIMGRYLELFTPINLGGNRFALRLYDRPNLFANGRAPPNSNMEQVLGASSTSIDNSAMLRVAEPVHRREVTNVVFNLTDSRVYNVGDVDKFTDERSNFTSVEQSGTFRVSYTISQTQTWNDSVSVTSGLTASWSSSIPYVGTFGVEVSEERSQTVEWGSEITEEQTIEYEQSVNIPPGKKITILVLATRAQCDVPFSCQVRDTMTDGTVRTYTKRDGLFMGANEFNVQTQLLPADL